MKQNQPAPLPGFSEVRQAAKRIRGRVKETPVKRFEALDRELGCTLFLKCEHLQPTGAFKLRGATNAVARLRELGDKRAVATHSSGNHGAALALAARLDGRAATVVMPDISVPAKIQAVRDQGAEVILCEPSQQAREDGLARLVDSGMVAIPPYDHDDIIAGQGTAALELVQAFPDLDCLLTPVGGGGLLSGSALAAHGLAPAIRVFGAEPAGAADTHASLERGQRVSSWQPETIADGLRALVGEKNFAIISQHAEAILLAEETEITDAMRWVFEATGMVIEPSSAVAFAVIRKNTKLFKGQKVGIIVTGRNVDLELFPWLAETGN